jgi:hypothetical protein
MSEKFARNCPQCGKEILHTNKYYRNHSERDKRPCRACNLKPHQGKGEKAPFFGKKHTQETINKLRERDTSRWKTDEFKKKMSVVTKGERNPMHGRTVYGVWVEKYGQEEADKRYEAMLVKQKARSTGKRNPMYGKPSPSGSGNGWSGWYKDWYFRSLRELSYVINHFERNGIAWTTGETIRIPYTDPVGRDRTYSPDFIVGGTIIEVKPLKLHPSPLVTAKRLAAEAYCSQNGLVYLLTDATPLTDDEIQELHERGEIVFLPRYEKKFQERMAVRSKTPTLKDSTDETEFTSGDREVVPRE